jgi:PAS domain-containing protein
LLSTLTSVALPTAASLYAIISAWGKASAGELRALRSDLSNAEPIATGCNVELYFSPDQGLGRTGESQWWWQTQCIVRPPKTQRPYGVGRFASNGIDSVIEANRRRIELQLAILEHLPDAKVVVDETGVIVLINAQTELMFGYHRSELVGQKVEILLAENET